jgi:plasmid stabilization system protein ParE
MVRKVVVTSKADEDFVNIINYLEANWSIKEINNFINKFDDKVQIILDFPYIYPSISINTNIRKCTLTSQISIYYEIKKDIIRILRLFDNRMSHVKLIL